MSLLERCPHFGGCYVGARARRLPIREVHVGVLGVMYVHSSMELGPEFHYSKCAVIHGM